MKAFPPGVGHALAFPLIEAVFVVPEVWIQRVAGVGFIVMGVLFLAGKG